MRRLSLAQRFLIGSLVILLAGMSLIGVWVSRQIEGRVIQRTAATTALYVDSMITNSLQDLATGDAVSAEGARRLRWLLEDTEMGQQVVNFRVWDPEGRIVFCLDETQVGQVYSVDDELRRAWDGGVSAAMGQPEGGVVYGAAAGDELLEIYSPVRSRDTDEVIAVAEFYYATDDLQEELAGAQQRSWLVVGGVAVATYLLLAVFVQRASNTIERQQRALAGQVGRLTELLDQNTELSERVRGAAARTTALNERFLRRFSAELHDGPAQDIGLALLQLDHVQASISGNGNGHANGDVPHGHGGGGDPERELELVQTSLRRALQEVRDTSAGLLLPHLGDLTLAETIDHAVRSHRRRTGSTVAVAALDLPEQVSLATKIALYRVTQEALTNAWRHADGASQTVVAAGGAGTVEVAISDAGPGFDPATLGASEERLGLLGMRERVESLGGEFVVESLPGDGTRVVARLPRIAEEPHG